MQANVSSTETTEIGNVAPVGVATPAAAPAPALEAGVAAEVADGFVLHVRFRPDATIWLIDECPSHFSPQEWYNFLCHRVGHLYAPRMGGRGDFRLSRAQLEALKVRNPS